MALDKLKNIFGGSEPDDEPVEEEFYNKSREEYRGENGEAGSKMMLLEPRAYSESQQIADYLKSRNAVVVNLKRVTPDQARRIIDFLSGTIYTIGGKLEQLGGGIFLCTPNNVNVEGKITKDNAVGGKDTPAPKGKNANTKDEDKDKKDDEEFNW
jgi:cell division inhibitor SepF